MADRSISVSASPPLPGRVLLVIPCFNEGGVIGKLLDEIRDLNREYDTLVIDDGSSDNSYVEASLRSCTVRMVTNLGIGGAVQTGIKYAHRKGYDFCVQIDGDGQHPPDQVAHLLDTYSRHPTNIVIGSRYLNNEGFRSTWARRFGSAAIAMTLRLFFTRVRVTDPTSGMRLIDRRAMALFSRHYPHDFPEPISLAWALRNGLTLGETSVWMRSRERGDSSIIGIKTLSYMVRVLCYIVLARFQPGLPPASLATDL